MNITPIGTLAKECAEEIMIDYTNCDSERLARLAFKERISNAIRQALKERERFMKHSMACWNNTRVVCQCGLDAVKKEMQ